jgi:predicted AlkP superfamily phosphohydrolase/phosphomutase
MEASKLVVIGWDGATWDLLEGWVEAGYLPNLAKLRQAGSSGSLRSTPLPLSPAAWSTIVTGQNPGRHGVFDWFERKPGSYAVEYVHTGRIAARPVWEYFNEGGKRIGIFCPPMLYPAVPIDGFMVSGMAAPNSQASDFAYPPELIPGLEASAGPYIAGEQEIFKTGREAAYLQSMLEWLDYQRLVVRFLLERYPCDAYLLVFMQSDHAQHKFWRYLDPAYPGYDPERDGRFRDSILMVYQALDTLLGELVAYFGETAHYVLLSDHGAGPTYGVMFINRWLRQEGLLRLKSGAATRLKSWLASSNLVLRVYHLASSVGLRRIAQRVSKPVRNKALNAFLSFEDIDWSRTKAYARGSFGQIYVNLKGREPQGIVEPGPDYEQLVGRILTGLQSLRHPKTGEPLITELHRREEVLVGPHLERAADVLFTIQDQRYQSSVKLGIEGQELLGPSEYEDSGSHRSQGILVISGPGIRPGVPIEGASVADICPTLLALAGIAVPPGLDGRVLEEVLTEELRDRIKTGPAPTDGESRRAEPPDLAPEELAQLEDRLRSLGYLG